MLITKTVASMAVPYDDRPWAVLTIVNYKSIKLYTFNVKSKRHLKDFNRIKSVFDLRWHNKKYHIALTTLTKSWNVIAGVVAERAFSISTSRLPDPTRCLNSGCSKAVNKSGQGISPKPSGSY